MNEIVSLAKENELQDYKLIYPNNKNLKVNFTDNYTVARLITGGDSNVVKSFGEMVQFK